MIALLSNSLVLIGTLILLGSLLTVRRIVRQLPLGGSRNSWYAMAGLIILFIAGYLGYLTIFHDQHKLVLDLMVPGIFFFGACFVWLSAYLAMQTAMDVMRITVLEHETFTDPLTGVYNRRFMEQRLSEEVSKARRYKFDLAVLILDLDHFKRVNDEHGHQVGDRLLIELARLVSTELRDSDIFARYGGEEFLIIAPNTGANEAVGLAERLRNCIEAKRYLADFDNGQHGDIRITVSIGVANYSAEVCDETLLIGAADSNLYRAKEAGRNQVAASSE